MFDDSHRPGLIRAAATLVAAALTDSGVARRLMGQTAQAGSRAPDVWELFDHVLARLEQRAASSAAADVGLEGGPIGEIYVSSNGDRWTLVVLDTITGSPLIGHQPNPASGRTASRIELQAFLAMGHGPEQQSLLRMIGSSLAEAR